MSPPRAHRRAARPKRPSHGLRRRRVAVLVLGGAVAAAVLLVTAFGGGDHPAVALTAPASASRLLPAGPPELQAVAKLGSLTIELPVNQHRITAIGYHDAADGALELAPLGSQANQGILKRLERAIFGGGSGRPHWYLLSGSQGTGTSALDVGAPPGTDVYAPVAGTIVGIEKVFLDGAVHGERIDIQPESAPSLVVSVANIVADPSLTVGSAVTAGSSKLGELLDLSRLETQALAKYTNDAGNHVLVEVHAAATLAIR